MSEKQVVQTKKETKIQNIEFLRFLFSVIIVYLHMCILPDFVKIETYKVLATNCSKAYICVDFFLIIAGFFLYKTAQKTQNISDFVINKIARLWPVLAVTILSYIIIGKTNGYTAIMDLLFLHNVGITIKFSGIIWFISPYFWGMLFYFYILKNVKKEYVYLIMILIIYFSYVGVLNYGKGSFDNHYITIFYFFNVGMMRVLASVGLGYFIGMLYQKYILAVQQEQITRNKFICMTFLEVWCGSFILWHLLVEPLKDSDFYYIIIFCVFFILMLLRQGAISNLLENKFSGWLGRFSYSIYVMQQTSYDLLNRYVWADHPKTLIFSPILVVVITLIFSIILGMLTYRYIEVPGNKYIKKILNGRN